MRFRLLGILNNNGPKLYTNKNPKPNILDPRNAKLKNLKLWVVRSAAERNWESLHTVTGESPSASRNCVLLGSIPPRKHPPTIIES